jgi:glutamate synthase (NADPH/NADH) large chain
MEKVNSYAQKQGLYDPLNEKDNCGVGFAANLKGEKSHQLVKQGLQILSNLKHRGAVGADASTGDGSGIMVGSPHEFFERIADKIGIALPDEGNYAVGMIFLPQDPNTRLFCEGVIERIIREENQILLGWREVPVDESACGELAKATRPIVMQVFISSNGQDANAFDRKLLIIRKRTETEVQTAFMSAVYRAASSSIKG